MIEVPAGHLFLGERTGADHDRTGEAVLLEAADLTTHGVIVGMTGSGKTGLGVGLIEEALLQGIPTLAIDPKGDLGNLLLTFPDLAPESFAPWVEGADPAQVAETWRGGLESWGIGPERIRQLRDGCSMTIYTPGSTSGVGLNVLGSLKRPPEGTDHETVVDEVQGFVSGLLRLVGIDADPLSSREHILLARLVQDSWDAGRDLDLPGLVAQVQAPPLRKLGVFDIDQFFPPADRTELALRLNALLASPAFAAWGQGSDLDIGSLLRPGGADGPPGCAIVSLAHLSDDERQFVVTLVLSKLVTWMRRQPGTDQLRVLVYFDEVVGYVPPTAAPPAKGPILTLLKQARAFGVGLVLATQNPVDVDYRALSNAGTWMIGRLQTEQDKARLLDGLSAAAGGVDIKAVGDTIAGLAKREFVLREPGSTSPTTFTTRWAMSYLRGPLTRDQISTLMAAQREVAAAVPTGTAGPAPSPTTSTDPAGTGTGATAASDAPDDAVPVAPTVAGGVPVRWMDPGAPWAREVGADPASSVFAPAVVATVDLLYDETKADLRHTEQYECVLFPLSDPPDMGSLASVDHDPRDLRDQPPHGATYRIPPVDLGSKTFFTDLQRRLTDHLTAERTMQLYRNPELKLYSRPGETEEQFLARCDAAADQEADAEAAKLAKKYEARIRRARDALAAAQDRLEQAEEAASSRKNTELLGGVGDLLGSLLGGRRSARSLARRTSTIVGRRGRTNEARQRVEAAGNRVAEKARALEELEAEMADELAAIGEEWDSRAAAVEPFEVPLEKSDVRVTNLALVWLPVG